MSSAVSNAMKAFRVNPMSCIIWRDGVGDATIKKVAQEEIPAIRQALQQGIEPKDENNKPQLAYMVCQKRINTKLLSPGGEWGMPAGTMVEDLQGPEYKTFYINGTSPPYSTAKPLRVIVAERDEKLQNVSMTDLTWALCHDYANWSGPIKLPSPVQMAHKLAELAGGFVDCGESIDKQQFTNTIYFL
eukprot:CAMPEP_0118718310 /NCGR_PEP_ID=MMETSP0800-20121206/28729_1 /TAXON_ID=210618 ORGANISM="Striatella unipunctata, Strain CCMP2910" /NCGR_SAMPLE_ID=MMETSP0800 /ASSEMBLY_ACC=CAM_ASM_000638 /LENGTH=187 /DNA_ID=CAMNT_0006625315 /DNA_START=239 /DNA_END=802 /DNA_ORIENTATION=-